HLDPSDAVPERVRNAFDALSEGVLIVDPREHVLLSNISFNAFGPDAARGTLVGRKASELEWLAPANQDANADATPWLSAMKSRQAVRGQPFRIVRDGVIGAKVIVNCSPVLDERQGVRGCLVTVDDVTALEQSHEQLLEVLADLATSKEQLEISNAELEDLASRDVLSGCLNRRAFFVALERRFGEAAAQGEDLVCIMSDIDHFQSINDKYGHGVGDEAIRIFAGLLGSCVREDALVGRYGGEEFCVVVAGVGFERGLQIAETMRRRVEDESGVGASAGHEIALSASFGVTALRLGARNVAELVDQADQAMYVAKHSGRNRVIAFTKSESAKQADAVEVLS
ncbi:MAG: diguanylate cyclase, partial [Caldimonas sp.]